VESLSPTFGNLSASSNSRNNQIRIDMIPEFAVTRANDSLQLQLIRSEAQAGESLAITKGRT
jgi:hypothetical protein